MIMNNFHHPQPLTDEQIALLEAIKPHILEEHYAFDMDYVLNSCGTPSCIAGHCASWLGAIKKDGNELSRMERYFGMPLDEHGDTREMPLFYVEMWDSDLYNDYYWTEGAEHAEVAIRAIDRYIANTKARSQEAQP